MKKLRLLYLYLKYHQEINHYYWYGIEEGYISDENYNWEDRTNLWLKAK